MFFMFHILVFTIYFCKISSSARAEISDLTDYFEENEENYDSKNKEQEFSTHTKLGSEIPMFLVKNLTTTRQNNLKLNVFDKMLSDEMFSMKQRFFEKDLAYTTTVQRVTKSNVATPTLEVKQKWPVVEKFTKTYGIEDENDKDLFHTVSRETKHKKSTSKSDFQIKSLDVRSLSGHPENMVHNQAVKCNCANANTNHQCKHGDDCTRNALHVPSVTTPPPFYIPYQAYFISDNNENLFQNTHYQPKVMNELKIPKSTKRRKPTSSRDEDLYYDDDKVKRKPPKVNGEIIMNIDYEIEETKKPEYALNCVHEDLNEIFSKGVQRKCYCSLSHEAKSSTTIIFICLLISMSECLGMEFILSKYKVA